MRVLTSVRTFALFFALFFIGVAGSACAQESSKTVIVPLTQSEGDIEGGLFVTKGKIGTVEVDFIVDTGASGVMISLRTAYAIGLDRQEPIQWIMGYTAGGPMRMPIFLLPEVAIGDIKVQSVTVTVAPRGVEVNLLGMGFLMKLKRFEYKDGVLTLEQ